jgi:3-methyladenine DNA glycosylase AlkD
MVPTAQELLERLSAAANADNVRGMARFGISPVGTLGISMPVLRGMAKALRPAAKRDPDGVHALAQRLWDSDVHEARILAALVDVPALVTREQADAWVADIDSWDVCDQLCGALLGATPFAWAASEEWAADEREFVRRAGFVLMAVLAVRDKNGPNDPFLHFLTIVERGATDERNFVKKAVNWALRQIGKRNRELNAAAVEVAASLRDSGSRAARWVASDALRELTSDKVRARLT